MNWFSYIFHLSVVYFVFGFLWKWIVVLPFALLMSAIGIRSLYPTNIVNVVGNYFLAAFTAFYSIAAHSIFIFILGAIFLLLQNFLNIASKIKEARESNDYELEDSLLYSFFAVLFGLVMYIIIYFIPEVGINSFTEWFSHSINWVATLPIIEWVVGLIALLNTLNIIFYGFIGVFGLIGALGSTLRRNNDEVEM